MKDLNSFLNDNILEKLKLNSNSKFRTYDYNPDTKNDLRQIIKDIVSANGIGTKMHPLDLNNINIGEIDDLSYLFFNNDLLKIEYIDISEWDVKNVTKFEGMFMRCVNLKTIGDISRWNMTSAKNISKMFRDCYCLDEIGDLSKWTIKDNLNYDNAFSNCKELKNKNLIPEWYYKE